jgi:drug/metabolite transporter (DMT)-like permease
MTAAAVAQLGSNVIVLGLAAAALWGVSDFLGGIAARRASAVLVVAVAHGVSLAALAVTAAAIHPHFPDHRNTVWALITGVSGGFAVILFYRALALGAMGLTAALTGLLTALVPVAVSWFTEGRPSETQLAGFVIAAVAICLIAYEPAHDPVEDTRPHPHGLLLGTIAGLGFGVYLVSSKYASPEHSSYAGVLWPLAYSRFASATLAMTIVLFLGRQNRLRKNAPKQRARRKQMYHPMRSATRNRWSLRRKPVFPQPEKRGQIGRNAKAPAHQLEAGAIPGILLLAGAAGLLEAVGNLLYMLSTVVGRLDVAAVLSSLYPAATILLAIWLLKERTTRSKALGMGLALVAVVVISL